MSAVTSNWSDGGAALAQQNQTQFDSLLVLKEEILEKKVILIVLDSAKLWSRVNVSTGSQTAQTTLSQKVAVSNWIHYYRLMRQHHDPETQFLFSYTTNRAAAPGLLQCLQDDLTSKDADYNYVVSRLIVADKTCLARVLGPALSCVI